MKKEKKLYEVPTAHVVSVEAIQLMAGSDGDSDSKKVQGTVSGTPTLDWGGTYDGTDGQPD